jgi:hypothetical protein
MSQARKKKISSSLLYLKTETVTLPYGAIAYTLGRRIDEVNIISAKYIKLLIIPDEVYKTADVTRRLLFTYIAHARHIKISSFPSYKTADDVAGWNLRLRPRNLRHPGFPSQKGEPVQGQGFLCLPLQVGYKIF